MSLGHNKGKNRHLTTTNQTTKTPILLPLTKYVIVKLVILKCTLVYHGVVQKIDEEYPSLFPWRYFLPVVRRRCHCHSQVLYNGRNSQSLKTAGAMHQILTLQWSQFLLLFFLIKGLSLFRCIYCLHNTDVDTIYVVAYLYKSLNIWKI